MSKEPPVKRSKQPDLILGALPADVINRTIGTELEAGAVIFTRAGQQHAARRHPEDYPVCFPHLARIIANPLYIGDDHRNPGKIEVMGRIAVGETLVLIAIDIERDAAGNYRLSSFYSITDKQMQGRRDKGFLKIAQAGRH